MRQACEKFCCELKTFIPIDGCAEDTKLPNNSIDFITVAQAFHWFDKGKTKIEFQRILRKHGKIILLWNRRESESEITKERDEICRQICKEFKGCSDGNDIDYETISFFKHGCCDYKIFDNDRFLTLESFIGGNLSASYAPSIHDDSYQIFVKTLTELFNKYSNNGVLLELNKTYSYIGEV